MSMSSTSGPDGAMCDINTTPLIDVMLVLLIMFIITIPVMTHAVKLDMPQPNQNPPPIVKPEVIDLIIDYDGTIVYNGTSVGSGATGVDVVEGYFRSETRKEPQPEIHLRPDKRAKYDTVARVLAAAQRNRMKKIGFVNVSEFKE